MQCSDIENLFGIGFACEHAIGNSAFSKIGYFFSIFVLF